jgi:uncharacterized protein (TIGR02646 family)
MRENNNKKHSPMPNCLSNLYFEQNWIAQEINLSAIGEKYKGTKIVINDPDDYYHGQQEYSIRYILRKLYFNKCAYCESRDYKPDVEHYRPKAEVSIDQPNTHGYYWLCFNWSNLLPSCDECNRPPGKGTQFPVSGARVTSPSFNECLHLIEDHCKLNSTYLNSEGPLLLNPELERPEPYLELKWNGRLAGTDGTNGKGWSSINTYDLNRGNLIDARAILIDGCRDKIINNLILFRDGILNPSTLKTALEIQFNFFRENTSPEIVHSFVYFFIYHNFSSFLNSKVPFVDEIELRLVNTLFSNYKTINS